MKIRWIRRHPAAAPKTLGARLGRMAKLVYTYVVRVNASPPRVATGVAVGVALGVLPTFGLGIPLAYLLAWVFRFNKAAAVAGSMISNPLTSPLIWMASAFAGAALTGGDWRALAEQVKGDRLFAAFTSATWIYMLGNGLITLTASAVAYGGAYIAVKRRQARRAAKGAAPRGREDSLA